MALDDQRLSVTEARLAAMEVPDAGCTEEARQAALARVREMGLPQRRDEYWKYTRPDTLLQSEAPRASLFDNDEGLIFDALERLRIIFVDGVFDPDASDDLSLEGVQIDALNQAIPFNGSP